MLGGGSRSRTRWNPTEQQQELFNKRKDDLLCFLTIFKEGVKANKVYGKFFEETDTEIPFKKMGFCNLGEFLYACRDIVRVKADYYGGYYLFLRGNVPSNVGHVRQLVQQQSGKSSYKGFIAKQNNTFDVPVETLLEISYDLRLTPANPPPVVAHSFMSSGYSTYPSRQRGGSRSRSKGSISRSRKSAIGGSGVPALLPMNAAAVALSSSITNGVPALKPLNVAAASLPRSLLQSNPSTTTATLRTATLPVLRQSKPNLEHTKPVNKVPTLMPLSQIQKNRELNQTTGSPLLPPPTFNSSSSGTSTFNSSTLPLSGHNYNSYGGSGHGISQGSFRVRDDLPRPPPMATLRREVPPGLARAINMALNDDNEDNDDGLDYLSDNYSSEDEFLFMSSQQPGVINRRLNSLEDESMDEVDATANHRPLDHSEQLSSPVSTTAVKIQKESITTSNAANVLERVLQKEGNYDKDAGIQVEKFKFKNVKSAQGSKPMFKVERQMKLPDKEFDALLLGADPYGFIYIQMDCPRLREAFKGFLGQLKDFYSDTGRQNEFRMRPDEMRVSNLVVFEMMNVGFFRGRIDEVVTDVGYCVILDIDDCVYHCVKWDDIYHIDVKFTCARRLPMAVMCIQRGTQKVALTPQFEKMFSKGLEKLTENIKVKEIQKLDSLFKVPIVSIQCDEQDLDGLIYKFGGLNGSHPIHPITSLTAEQQETMDYLESKHHIIYTKV